MATGVSPTAGGQTYAKRMGAVVASYDLAVNDTRRALRGETDQVRIAYVPSVQQYLRGPLREVRRSHPETVLKLVGLAEMGSYIALPEQHRLATQDRVRLSELKGEFFVS